MHPLRLLLAASALAAPSRTLRWEPELMDAVDYANGRLETSTTLRWCDPAGCHDVVRLGPPDEVRFTAFNPDRTRVLVVTADADSHLRLRFFTIGARSRQTGDCVPIVASISPTNSAIRWVGPDRVNVSWGAGSGVHQEYELDATCREVR